MSEDNGNENKVRFTSDDADLVLVREEDTKPGKGISEKYRKLLQEKYGRKDVPPGKSPDDAKSS